MTISYQLHADEFTSAFRSLPYDLPPTHQSDVDLIMRETYPSYRKYVPLKELYPAPLTVSKKSRAGQLVWSLGNLACEFEDERKITPVQFVAGVLDILAEQAPALIKVTCTGIVRMTLLEQAKTLIFLPVMAEGSEQELINLGAELLRAWALILAVCDPTLASVLSRALSR